jgi:lipoyl(octanoyl) transferase
VYTLGKSGDDSNLLLNESALAEKQASFYRINRGGDITYHGPGQIVGYPVIDLDNFFTDIHKYLRLLEEGTWLEDPPGRPVIDRGPAGAWDHVAVDNPFVYREGDTAHTGQKPRSTASRRCSTSFVPSIIPPSKRLRDVA